MYQVLLRKEARKNFAKIDKRFKEKILTTLIELGLNPFLGKALEGDLDGRRCLRVWPYRIIYAIYKNRLIVWVISIRAERSGVPSSEDLRLISTASEASTIKHRQNSYK